MRVIGIDPGLGRCGWGVIEFGRAQSRLIAYGCIETFLKDGEASRFIQLKTELDEAIAEFKPDNAVVEQLFYFKNKTTIIQIGQARGVIMLALAEAKIPYQEVTPLQVKQNVTGYGKAEKAQVQKMVQTMLKLDHLPKPDDAADALAIALSYTYN